MRSVLMPAPTKSSKTTPKDSGKRFSEFTGQQHPDLQTDEDMRQRQSHDLPDDDYQL